MKLLLTGATGFVGRNCLLRALTCYDEIIAPVRTAEKLHAQLSAEGQASTLPHLRVLPADPRHWPAVDADHAILGAGVLFARDREEYFATNVEWTLSVLRTLPAKCRTVVLSSQSAGGPTPAGKAARTEEDTDTPITWYGESKLALEKAIRSEHLGLPITILRPPMILGARDTATLPLFRMARNLFRIKPGLQTKSYSFIAVDDLVEGVFSALRPDFIPPLESCYIASSHPITDWELIGAAAAPLRTKGITLPVPQAAVRVISALVDAVPSLRASTPSLTRDRAREIWPNRWVVDTSRFSRLSGWQARRGLAETLQAAHDHYVLEGSL